MMLMEAYGVKAFQISVAWTGFGTGRWNVLAKAEGFQGESLETRRTSWVQSLLADRGLTEVPQRNENGAGLCLDGRQKRIENDFQHREERQFRNCMVHPGKKRHNRIAGRLVISADWGGRN